MEQRGALLARAVAVSVAAALVLSACTGAVGHARRASAGTALTLPIGDYILPSQMANMNPFSLTGNYQPLFQYLYNPLFYFDPVNGKTYPDLATKGTWNSSHSSYTVTLNARARWQDGKPVTAADVVYTYDVLHRYPAADPYDLWSRLTDVSGSGHRVVFHVRAAFPGLRDYLTTVYIVPKAAWQGAPDPLRKLNRHPVGSGPFSFVKYTNGVAIVLKRNPNYFLGAPHIGYLEIKTYSNAESVTLALEKGTIKMTLGTLAMPSLPSLLKTKTNRLQRYPGLENFVVMLNTAVPGLRNVYVRRAIERAMNQRAIIEKGSLGAGYPANPGWLPPVFHGYLDHQALTGSAYQFNIKAAKTMMRKAGYSYNATGLAERNGRPLELSYYAAAGAPAQEKQATMFQGWLRQIGIETKLRLVTWPELTSLARLGRFQLVQLGVLLPPDPVEAMVSSFSKAATAPVGAPAPGLNYSRLVNPTLESLFSQARSTYTTSKREALVQQMQTIVARLAPFAVMTNLGGHIVYRTASFTGYDTNFPVFSPFSLDRVRKG